MAPNGPKYSAGEDQRATAIVVAGGRGTRMGGGGIPKQYRKLLGVPMLCHTLSRFEAHPAIRAIILVIRPQDEDLCNTLVSPSSYGKVRAVVPGGGTRLDSVCAGLAVSDQEDDLLLVHDAVRPCTSDDLITAVIDAAARHGAVIPAVAATDTIKEVDDSLTVVATLDRQRLRCAQTPQGFGRQLLLDAVAAIEEDETGRITDEAAAVERAGKLVHVIEGEKDNVKVTTEDDVQRVEWTMRKDDGEGGGARARVGIGYDVHKLVEGRQLVLGGVEIDHARGLEGHSDADVLVHAVIDALLGASGQGDIGRLFPDSDPRYKDISSLRLLADVRDRLALEGWRIANVDAVVMAQVPKLAPHVTAIQRSLAAELRIDEQRVSVKATTTEQLGFVGREEGMAAQAICLVSRSNK